ncbi:MAG: hypothetical protein K2Y28_02415 [Burkholderiaceae bacterium]|nr:hypothetical protein [Burkholderiaceae bacterium]
MAADNDNRPSVGSFTSFVSRSDSRASDIQSEICTRSKVLIAEYYLIAASVQSEKKIRFTCDNFIEYLKESIFDGLLSVCFGTFLDKRRGRF